MLRLPDCQVRSDPRFEFGLQQYVLRKTIHVSYFGIIDLSTTTYMRSHSCPKRPNIPKYTFKIRTGYNIIFCRNTLHITHHTFSALKKGRDSRTSSSIVQPAGDRLGLKAPSHLTVAFV